VQLGDFLHQGFVDAQATGGIDQQHVKVMLAGVVERRQANGHRLVSSA